MRKNIKFFHLKIIIFSTFKNCCILHGHVFVMNPKKCIDSGYLNIYEQDKFHAELRMKKIV